MATDLPNISILIPVRNEENFISSCIDTLLQGDYPESKIEVLVIDGNSTDNTAAKVNELSDKNGRIRLLANPKKIVPCALNVGIENASHDVVIWVGAHAEYSKNYLSECVKTLLNSNAASVGGVLEAKGSNRFSYSLALATSTKLGIGNAKYRYATTQQEVDTVFGGCWRKVDILKIGGFNEKWVRNQDYELNHRLRKNIGPIILNPKAIVTYFVRDSIPKLASQYYQYGFWRCNTAFKHPSSIGIRQLVPIAFTLSIITSTVIAPFNILLGSIIPLIYIICVSTYSFKTIQSAKNSNSPGSFLDLLTIYPTIHLSWGFGFLWNAAKSSIQRIINFKL